MQIDFTLWNRKLVSSEQQLEKQNASICRLNCHFVVFSFTTLLLALECVICFTPPWLCFDSFSQQLLGSFKNLFLALKLKFIFLLTHITLFQTFIFSQKIQLHEGILICFFEPNLNKVKEFRIFAQKMDQKLTFFNVFRTNLGPKSRFLILFNFKIQMFQYFSIDF